MDFTHNVYIDTEENGFYMIDFTIYFQFQFFQIFEFERNVENNEIYG